MWLCRIALAAFGIFLIYSGIKAETGAGDENEDAVGFQAFAHKALGCVGVSMSEENSETGAFCIKDSKVPETIVTFEITS